MYVLDAQINPLFPDYCIQLVKFVLPEVETHLVQQCMQDGSTNISSFNKLYGKYTKGLVLRLLQRQGQQLHQIREHILNGIHHAFMKFSNCGHLFSLFIPEDPRTSVKEQIITCRLGRNGSVFEFINQLEHNKYSVHFPQEYILLHQQIKKRLDQGLEESIKLFNNLPDEVLEKE